MLVHDQEGRSGLGVVHSIAYGISPAVTDFAENEIGQHSAKYVGGKNTLNLGSYIGPCPPASTGQHHYVFTLTATNAGSAELPAGLPIQEAFTRRRGRTTGAIRDVLRHGRPQLGTRSCRVIGASQSNGR